MSNTKFDFHWTLIGAMLLITCVASFAISSTIFQRWKFENSYQYSEARKSEIAELEAQLVEIDLQLSNNSVSETTKQNLRSQRTVINVRLRAAKEKNQDVLLKD